MTTVWVLLGMSLGCCVLVVLFAMCRAEHKPEYRHYKRTDIWA